MHTNARQAREWKLKEVAVYPHEDAQPTNAAAEKKLSDWRTNFGGMVDSLKSVEAALEKINHHHKVANMVEKVDRTTTSP